MDPNRPENRQVARFHDENHIINVGKKLENMCGISIRKNFLHLLQEVIDGSSKVGAKDSGREAFALKHTLRNVELSERRVRVGNVKSGVDGAPEKRHDGEKGGQISG